MKKPMTVSFTLTKPRNLMAEDLRTPKYRKRIVRSRKTYTRKAKHPEEHTMIYIWVKYDGETDWEPHMTFGDNDANDGTTMMTDAQAEISDLKADGHKAKKGPAF